MSDHTNQFGTAIPAFTVLETPEQGEQMLNWALAGQDELIIGCTLGIYRCHIDLGVSPKEAFDKACDSLTRPLE